MARQLGAQTCCFGGFFCLDDEVALNEASVYLSFVTTFVYHLYFVCVKALLRTELLNARCKLSTQSDTDGVFFKLLLL